MSIERKKERKSSTDRTKKKPRCNLYIPIMRIRSWVHQHTWFPTWISRKYEKTRKRIISKSPSCNIGRNLITGAADKYGGGGDDDIRANNIKISYKFTTWLFDLFLSPSFFSLNLQAYEDALCLHLWWKKVRLNLNLDRQFLGQKWMYLIPTWCIFSELYFKSKSDIAFT